MTTIAIENGPVEIVNCPIQHGGSFQFVFCKRLPEGNLEKPMILPIRLVSSL